jgi:hypothetical protein
VTRQKRTAAAPETPQEQSTALVLPDTPALVLAYDDPGQMAAILKRIETEEQRAAKIAKLRADIEKLEAET